MKKMQIDHLASTALWFPSTGAVLVSAYTYKGCNLLLHSEGEALRELSTNCAETHSGWSTVLGTEEA